MALKSTNFTQRCFLLRACSSNARNGSNNKHWGGVEGVLGYVGDREMRRPFLGLKFAIRAFFGVETLLRTHFGRKDFGRTGFRAAYLRVTDA